MKELLHIEDVEKYYGNKNNLTKAIDRISFIIDQGEFTAIMGASGSGKTTLLNLLATVDTVTSGHIWYGRDDITKMNEDQMADFRKTISALSSKDYNLLDTLTLKENIALAMSLTKKGKREIDQQTKDIMERLDIWSIRNKFPYQSPVAKNTRCACARALINHPKIVFADEPDRGPGFQILPDAARNIFLYEQRAQCNHPHGNT